MLDPLTYLREAHDQGLLVPFVGAGLGAAAASLPTWPQLLEQGISHAIATSGVVADEEWIPQARRLGRKGDYTLAFDLLENALGVSAIEPTSLEYEAFLAESFAEPDVQSRQLLKALNYLQPRRVVTTNYDTLLEDWAVNGGQTVTWQDAIGVRDIFRMGQGVIHLHGVWNRPTSVILSQRSYRAINSDQSARRIAEVIFHGKVLLFIGTSLDGTHDPHLGDLLGEFEALANPVRGETAPHILLMRGRISGAVRASLGRQGILPVSFGENFEDLPKFLKKVGDSGQVSVSTRPVDHLLGAINRADSLDDALRAVGSWIEREVFAYRNVRVSFSAKRPTGTGYELRRRAVIPTSSSGNPHHYPLSMSAWALVEGRPISWPEDRDRPADLAWLRRLNKLDRVAKFISDASTDEFPELKYYVDLAKVRTGFQTGGLTLGDFFQDWASDQPTIPYAQFLTIPVPWLEGASTRDDPSEYGVFNVDTLESTPLLNRRSQELLRLASAVATTAFRIFSDRDCPQDDVRESRPN